MKEGDYVKEGDFLLQIDPQTYEAQVAQSEAQVANAKASAVAQALLERGLGPDTPLMVISGNSIVHAVMMLGAMKARGPVAPVSVAYSLMSGDHSKLRHVFETAKPKMIFAEQGPVYARAPAALPLDQGHQVLIIGYNPDTKEIAWTDPWGRDTSERWMTQEEAQRCTLGEYYIISW